jgi:hypothetical protein
VGSKTCAEEVGQPKAALEEPTLLAVEPEQVRVWEDAFHILHVRVNDAEYHDVRAVRVFPISGRADYVSFLDEKGKEVALLARPHKLDKESQRALEKALGRMYYVAKILRVDHISDTMGVTHWQVLTDRGYAAFEVVDRQNLRKLPRGRFIIVDADGNRFEIEDINELDSRSQAWVFSET